MNDRSAAPDGLNRAKLTKTRFLIPLAGNPGYYYIIAVEG